MTRSVDVRVIAASNRDLKQLITDGAFREDLYYRLSVFPIEVPPLRERKEDVVQLAQHFLDSTCKDFGRKPMKLTRSQARQIREYSWPGNVRELKNVIERAVILSQGGSLRLGLSMPSVPFARLGKQPAVGQSRGEQVLTEKQMKDLQRRNIVAALKQCDWRVSGKRGAAEMLGLKPTTLADRIRTYGIRKPAE
jgi:transcriptional regulator with GAF, ATPase, and Fis domain